MSTKSLLLVISLIFIVYISLLVLKVKNKIVKSKICTRNLKSFTSFSPIKSNCSVETVKCSNDSDCVVRCKSLDGREKFTCQQGVCKVSITPLTHLDCDPSKGLVKYLIFDEDTQKYHWICKSSDVGIALESGNNKMCQGGEISIDYTKKLPSICDCKCRDSTTFSQSLIPATSEIRAHVICDDKFGEIIAYGNQAS